MTTTRYHGGHGGHGGTVLLYDRPSASSVSSVVESGA